MARKPVSMRKVRKILQLKHEAGLGARAIARSLRMSHGTVLNYLERAKAAGLSWPLPAELHDGDLQDLFFGAATAAESAPRALPSMSWVHTELRRSKGMTLQLLWEEYRRREPDGYGYTQFCEYYKRYCSGLEPALRQVYAGGEKLFVDWAGETLRLTDGASGESGPAYLFVATLGASNYTYAEAFEDMRQAAWIEAHIHAWEFLGGVAKVTVADNTKTAVVRACRYEPELNSAYEELCERV